MKKWLLVLLIACLIVAVLVVAAYADTPSKNFRQCALDKYNEWVCIYPNHPEKIEIYNHFDGLPADPS